MFDRAPMLGQVKVAWMGQPTGGQGQGTPGAGGPSVSVSHAFSGTGSPIGFQNFQQFRDFGWYPPYYNYPIYQQPAPPARMICRRLERESEEEGTDVFACTPEAPAYPRYSGYSAFPVTYVRPGWF